MVHDKYEVFIKGGVGSGFFDTLTDAIIFAEALFEKYYDEPDMEVVVKRLCPVNNTTIDEACDKIKTAEV